MIKMRIKTLDMSWFRGAGRTTAIQLGGRSLLLYGPNGSGKSTICDALELFSSSKIRHLSHEYAQADESKALRNTHAPDDESL